MGSVGGVQEQVASAVQIKVMQLANEQQQQEAVLVEEAVETAQKVQEPGKGTLLDLLA
jgi:hypothetical protein